MVSKSDSVMQVQIRYQPDLQRQVLALLLLLDHVVSAPETRQPQDHEGPRAETVATAANGHNLSELNNGNKDRTIST
jgi:hypothetical protein